MIRIEKIDPQPPDDNADPPPAQPHHPINPDPTHPIQAPPGTEPKPSEPTDLDWAEHED